MYRQAKCCTVSLYPLLKHCMCFFLIMLSWIPGHSTWTLLPLSPPWPAAMSTAPPPTLCSTKLSVRAWTTQSSDGPTGRPWSSWRTAFAKPSRNFNKMCVFGSVVLGQLEKKQTEFLEQYVLQIPVVQPALIIFDDDTNWCCRSIRWLQVFSLWAWIVATDWVCGDRTRMSGSFSSLQQPKLEL